MAKVKNDIQVPIEPEKAWEYASDLTRYDEWMSIHEAWRSEIPETISQGTEMSSIVVVKGVRVRFKWVITKYSPPESVEIKGTGIGGAKVDLTLSVRAEGTGSRVKLECNLGGKPLFGPAGMVFAQVLKGDIDKSLKNFLALFA